MGGILWEGWWLYSMLHRRSYSFSAGGGGVDINCPILSPTTLDHDSSGPTVKSVRILKMIPVPQFGKWFDVAEEGI